MSRRPTFAELVEQALAAIPREFREAMDAANVSVVIREQPEGELRDGLSDDPDDTLYGAFVGLPLAAAFTDDDGLPPLIFIFQRPLEEDFPDLIDLRREIEVTIAHELGHFLGLDEDDLADRGYA